MRPKERPTYDEVVEAYFKLTEAMQAIVEERDEYKRMVFDLTERIKGEATEAK